VHLSMLAIAHMITMASAGAASEEMFKPSSNQIRLILSIGLFVGSLGLAIFLYAIMYIKTSGK